MSSKNMQLGSICQCAFDKIVAKFAAKAVLCIIFRQTLKKARAAVVQLELVGKVFLQVCRISKSYIFTGSCTAVLLPCSLPMATRMERRAIVAVAYVVMCQSALLS
jgi:hypothetical protein